MEASAGLCSSAVANPSHGAGVALWVTLRILEVRMRRMGQANLSIFMYGWPPFSLLFAVQFQYHLHLRLASFPCSEIPCWVQV